MLRERKDLACLDPYDPWVTGIGVKIKDWFYQGKLVGKLLAIIVAVIDWLFPGLSRKLMGSERKYYPITVAQWVLSQPAATEEECFNLLMSTATPENGKHVKAWGLGFPWMSKNGLYAETVPFVTHTPYAMEALLKLKSSADVGGRALEEFKKSLAFLDSLLVMHEDEEQLALSYAPISEPRMVVNANSYAAYSYALHVAEGGDAYCKERAIKLARWVVAQQNGDGSWHYYADSEPGNFIDCFHSCFVIKNLYKLAKLLPEAEVIVSAAIERGIAYLDQNFIDPETGLAKRFVERDIKDPFVWDLYDQAEYLGVLLDQNRFEEAERFKALVDATFCKGGSWFCRKDMFGRLWGKGFYRWGIMPYFYQCARLQNFEQVSRTKEAVV